MKVRMDNFIKLSPSQRSRFIQKTADDFGLPEHIIEKDFWVCWLLKRLFSLDEIAPNLTFKGGTSLSKVYGIIRRFSEDIDISIEKSFLGFYGEKDPRQAQTKKQASKLIKGISQECKEFVQSILKNQLERSIDKWLGAGDGRLNGFVYKMGKDWEILVDEEDNEGQTLLFYYPVAEQKSEYIRPAVKIELGARADHWPVEIKTMRSYIAEATPQGIAEKDVEIRVLSVERTFWEKATILHMYANYPESKKVPIRQSRHFYDFYCLLNSEAKEKALCSADLLTKVSDHKKLYFRAGRADYTNAKRGSLKIIPPDRVLRSMQEDYIKMKEMFFDDPPKWRDIVETLKAFEDEFNC